MIYSNIGPTHFILFYFTHAHGFTNVLAAIRRYKWIYQSGFYFNY